MIVVDMDEQKLDNNHETASIGSATESGEDEADTNNDKVQNGPRKDQTEHRLVIKVNKKAKKNILMIPLETIRMRRKTIVDMDCPSDVLNYV